MIMYFRKRVLAITWFLIRKSLISVKEVVEFYANGPDLNVEKYMEG